MPKTVCVSLWYNWPDKGPAIPERPDLGADPHAQAVMSHFGITYADAVPHTIGDSWSFTDCQNIPDKLPSFMTVYDRP